MTDSEMQPTIVLTREWPFVRVVEQRETRGDHAVMTLMMMFGAAAFQYSVYGPTGVGIVLAFIAGYAFNNWLTYERADASGGESA